MRSILALIIFSDGAAAFLGAVLASRVRTQDDKRPEIIKVLMVGLFGYSLARFWSAWNAAAHGQEVIACVAAVSPRYLWHQYGALGLQACAAWAATIYLIGCLLNGHVEKFRQRVRRVIGKVRRRK